MSTRARNRFSLDHSLASSIIFSIGFLALAAAMFIILETDWNLYLRLVEEGAASERLSAIFYLVSGILLLIASRRVWRQERTLSRIILTVLLGLFFIFVAGEEESWGQWIFDYEVSEEIREVNVQDEINIHNLGFFAKLSPHRILVLFVLGIGIVLPAAYRFTGVGRRLMNRFFFGVGPLSLAGPFAIALAYEKVAYSLKDHWAHGEAMEFIISVAILLYGISVLSGQNRLPD